MSLLFVEVQIEIEPLKVEYINRFLIIILLLFFTSNYTFPIYLNFFFQFLHSIELEDSFDIIWIINDGIDYHSMSACFFRKLFSF